MGYECIIGDAAGLGKAVDTFAGFCIYVAVDDLFGQVILFKNIFGDEFDRNTDVFITFHIVVEVKILDVDPHEFAARGRDDIVENDFTCGEGGCFGANISWIINTIAAGSEPDSSGIVFHWAVGHYQAEVGGFSVLRHFMTVDEEKRVRAFDSCIALGKAADFVGTRGLPQVAVRAFEELGVFCEVAGVGIDSFEGKAFGEMGFG